MSDRQFFITSSFMIDFFMKYQDDFIDGKNTEEQDEFKNFIQSGAWYILFDEPIEHLQNYPHLFKIFHVEHSKQYMPYDPPPKPMKFKGYDEQEEKEANGIIKCVAAFSNTFTNDSRNDLERKRFKPVFNSEKVEKSWLNYSRNPLPDIDDRKTYSWKKILKNIDLPSSGILLVDSYLLGSKEKINNNLIPILKRFSMLTDKKISVNIVGKEYPKRFTPRGWKERWDKKLNKQFKSSLDVKVWIYEGILRREHDRRLLTDFRLINMPSGFDLLNNEGKARTNTDPSVRSVFSNDLEHAETIQKRRKTLTSVVEAAKKQYNSL